MILNRHEFVEYWSALSPTDNITVKCDNHPLWAMERYLCIENEIFLRMTQPAIEDNMWAWGKENLTSQAICYSASLEYQWWGFKSREDLIMWMLRWGS